MTNCNSVNVMLQFPAMTEPCEMVVSVRDAYLLERHTEQCVEADGTIVYRLPSGWSFTNIASLAMAPTG